MYTCVRALATCGVGPLREAWEVWLRAWAGKIKAQEGGGAAAAIEMRRASPKYVPREWMLVEAYTKANAGDYSELEALHELFKHPYDEQEAMAAKYYKKVRLSRVKPHLHGHLSAQRQRATLR